MLFRSKVQFRVLRVNKVLRAQHLVLRELRVVRQEPKVHKDQQDQQEELEVKELKVHKEEQVEVEDKGLKDQEDHRVTKVLKVRLVLKALQLPTAVSGLNQSLTQRVKL